MAILNAGILAAIAAALTVTVPAQGQEIEVFTDPLTDEPRAVFWITELLDVRYNSGASIWTLGDEAFYPILRYSCGRVKNHNSLRNFFTFFFAFSPNDFSHSPQEAFDFSLNGVPGRLVPDSLPERLDSPDGTVGFGYIFEHEALGQLQGRAAAASFQRGGKELRIHVPLKHTNLYLIFDFRGALGAMNRVDSKCAALFGQ